MTTTRTFGASDLEAIAQSEALFDHELDALRQAFRTGSCITLSVTREGDSRYGVVEVNGVESFTFPCY